MGPPLPPCEDAELAAAFSPAGPLFDEDGETNASAAMAAAGGLGGGGALPRPVPLPPMGEGEGADESMRQQVEHPEWTINM